MDTTTRRGCYSIPSWAIARPPVDDPLDAARGILCGVVVGVAMWVLAVLLLVL